MAGNQVITVKEADGVTLTDVEVLGTGRQAAATSKSLAWSTEDQAAIGIITETVPAGDTASSGLNGRLQRIAQRISSLIGLFPNALGASGGLKVEIVAGAGSGGTAIADAGTFVAGTTQGTPTGGFYQTTVTANPLSTGKFGWSQVTPFRANHVNLRDALGNELVLPAALGGAGGLKVEVVSGPTGGTSIADGGTFVAGTTTGTPVGGFYQTTVTSNPLTAGKFGWSQLTSFRAQHINLRDSLGNEMVMAASTGSPLATQPAIPVTIRDANANINAVPSVTATAGSPVVGLDPYSQYETVAASAAAQVMGATGAQYDYLAGVLIIPAAAAAGAVSITDGNGSAIQIFAGGGTVALPSLVPFMVPLGLYALAATTPGWKITTGASVSAIGIGKFT